MATHLSVGFADTVGTGVEESPDTPSVSAEEHAIGIENPDNCFQAEGEADPDEITAAVTTHGFCGHLSYNHGTPALESTGPTDQIYNDENFVDAFDVQRTWYVGNLLLGTCLPMCDDDGGAQNQTWNAFHTVGDAAGLTEGPEEADDGRGEADRFQWYQMQLDIRNAPGIVQSNTGAWEMNGWAHPYALEHFVGFLFNENGAVTDQDLNEYVADNMGTLFGPQTTSKVCGFTPDIDFVSTGEQSFCEVELTYSGDDPNNGTENDDRPFSSYNDRCDTPTYVCGAAGGNYWEGDALGLAAYGGDGDDYTAWHWTIAPNQPECSNANPGFDLSVADDTATERFVAHDLDVYTPPTALSAGPPASVENPQDYADQVLEEQVFSLLPGTGGTDDQVYALADENSQFVQGDTLERNHVDTDTAIDDNSRQIINEDRTLSDCELLDSDETPETVDPWVNYLDGGISDRSVGAYFGVATTGTSTPSVGLYTDESADDENDPTPDTYTPNGFVGVFSDKNDDADYDQVVGSSDSTDTFSPAVYQDTEVQATGAYPMLWDMWVNVDDGEATINQEQGCTGPGTQEFALTMDEAGYGPNTGIAQAIYLSEPTVFYDTATTNPQTQPYAGGNNIYVLGNQAVKALWDGDIDADNGHQLDSDVDQLVEGLQNFVASNYDVAAGDIGIAQPGEVFGLDSDYLGQCGESTGGFTGDISFVHNCETGCAGDTIATMYSYEVQDTENIGGGEIPILSINNDGVAYDFPTSEEDTRWFDIDAFDGDADRNEQRDPAPPTGE